MGCRRAATVGAVCDLDRYGPAGIAARNDGAAAPHRPCRRRVDVSPRCTLTGFEIFPLGGAALSTVAPGRGGVMRKQIACLVGVLVLVCGIRAPGQQQCTDTSDKCTAFSCQDGSCTGTPIVTCTDPDACTVSTCNPQTGACDNTARNCDDGNPCTDDSCVLPGGCVHTPHGGSCNTGNPCSTGACLTIPQAQP